MGWFKRLKEGINTRRKKVIPDGVWYMCPDCRTAITSKEHAQNYYVCLTEDCLYHTRIGSAEYFDIIFDGRRTYLFDNLVSKDFLNFKDLKTYEDRLVAAKEKTNLNDAITVARGKVNRLDLVVAAMDFKFIGGSMGSVVGEKIALSIDYCLEHKVPFLLISKSGGARMMESAFSLMQMAKTASRLTRLAKAKIPYFSMMTDPTTGGVTASYAMLGDINFAEPKALIGFAGPRVIKETIKKDLPAGFQTSEFLLDHGFLDFIVHRKDLKQKIGDLLHLFRPAKEKESGEETEKVEVPVKVEANKEEKVIKKEKT